MFCTKCGTVLQDGSQFCPCCGNKIEEDSFGSQSEVKVMLDPSEVVPAKKVADSSKSLSGQGSNIGLILIIVSIIIDLFSLVTGLFPLMILGTILFVVGGLIRLFSH